MSKEFKKGQKVVVFSSWDGKGTWTYTRAVVKSCGVKQMTLLNAATEEMMGNHFAPNSEKTYSINWQGKVIVKNHTHFTMADMTEDEAISVCLEAAKAYLAEKNEHYDECIARNADKESYCNSINRDRAELHEPRAVSR